MLRAFRILDLTTEMGWLCGKILGDLGADVIKIELRRGSWASPKTFLQEGSGPGEMSLLVCVEPEQARDHLKSRIRRGKGRPEKAGSGDRLCC